MESGGEPGTGGGTEPSQGGGTEPGPGGDSGQGGDPQLIEIAEAAVIEDIPAVVYNRKQHTPVPVVSGVSGDELVEGLVQRAASICGGLAPAKLYRVMLLSRHDEGRCQHPKQ